MLALLAAGFIGGTLLGFVIGYIVAGAGATTYMAIGDFILVLLLTVGGAAAGLIAVTAYRVGQRWR